MTEEEEAKLVDSVADKLMEHFDVVRIFCSRHDGNTGFTSSYTVGRGNFHAQRGQVTAWIVDSEQREREHAKKTAREEEE